MLEFPLILHLPFLDRLQSPDLISLTDLWVPGSLLGVIMLAAVYFVRVNLK